MLKILAVGNSYSQDATALIQSLTDKLFVRNLYYPACSLKAHVEFFEQNKKAYEYQMDGENSLSHLVTLQEALAFEAWDYVTIQQRSGLSGVEDSYQPYARQLVEFIRAYTDAKIVFHQTWTYEATSDHPDFVNYGNDLHKMWHAIEQATTKTCHALDLPVIASGKAIYSLCQTQAFYGGKGLYRDGFHLSLDFGRFTSACVWIKFFTHQLPQKLQGANLTPQLLAIKNVLE